MTANAASAKTDFNALSNDEFRARWRQWLDQNYPEDWRRPIVKRLQGVEEQRWLKMLNDDGWRLPAWPKEHGGMGLSIAKQLIYFDELDDIGAARFLDMGGNLLGPVLIKYGTAEQKARYLPEIAAGGVIWCQGYSEPNAGSDLASLKTSARREGDHYVVNGTKIWTTMVQFAKRMFLLVRTSQEERKQAGISFLMLDMDTPGVSFRTIENLAGDIEFGQVFFDDVRVPVENLIHKEGEGWTVAKALLGGERLYNSSPGHARHAMRLFERVLAARGLQDDPATKVLHARLLCDMNDFVALYHLVADATIAGTVEPHEFSVLKILATELFQNICDAALEIAGDEAGAWDAGSGDDRDDLRKFFMVARPASIYGGAIEIQRDIVARFLLGAAR